MERTIYSKSSVKRYRNVAPLDKIGVGEYSRRENLEDGEAEDLGLSLGGFHDLI